MKRILLIVLCLSMLILSACSAPVEESPAEESPIVTYKYKSELELVSYEQVWERHWWETEFIYGFGSYEERGYTVKQEPWTSDMLPDIEPNSTVIVITKEPYSCIHASLNVCRFLAEKNTVKRDFLLLPVNTVFRKCENDDIEFGERAKHLAEWISSYLPEGEIVGKTGHILWRGNAREMDALNARIGEFGRGNEVLVCFPDEFVEIYGVTFEQADILIEKGYLSIQCTPTIEDSPLYGMTPTEIAVYLAAHPELLEENA